MSERKPLEKWQHCCRDCAIKQCRDCLEKDIEYLKQRIQELELAESIYKAALQKSQAQVERNEELEAEVARLKIVEQGSVDEIAHAENCIQELETKLAEEKDFAKRCANTPIGDAIKQIEKLQAQVEALEAKTIRAGTYAYAIRWQYKAELRKLQAQIEAMRKIKHPVCIRCQRKATLEIGKCS